MDPPPPAAPLPSSLVNYPPPESVDSPPKRQDGGGEKLRLMCSYGGHIVPRPHDKSLCYIGGETRIVVVDRNSTVASLSARLSRSLSLNGRSFTLKYQLPNEDLDSLVSVASDEDLENMIEEYDRIAKVILASSSSSSLSCSPSPRIRLFVFFNKPATAASMGSIRSESWFLDSLNSGSPSGSESGFLLLPRNMSDTALVTGLVGNIGGDQHYRNQGHQDSLILVESFTSAVTDQPSEMGNLLPPILVADSGNQGFESGREQFQFGYRNQQLSSSQIQLENISITATAPNSFSSSSSSAIPPPPPSITPTGGSSENLNRLSSEDEDDTRSDHGRSTPAVGYRKPPLPLPHQHKAPAGGSSSSYNPPPSPDSVMSDSSSITSIASMAKTITSSYNQDQPPPPHNEIALQNENNNGNPNNVISTSSSLTINQTPSSHIPIHQQLQIQDPAATSAYTFMDHHQQQQQVQFLKPGPGGQLISSYYPIPPSPHQQHQHQQQQQLPYPAVYVMPMPMPMPQHHQPPLYPTKNSSSAASPGGKGSEMGVVYSANAFTSGGSSHHHHQLYHLHHHQQQFHPQQQQHQYVDAAANGYEYGAPNDQMFYAQQGMGTNVMMPPTPNNHLHRNHQHQYQAATIGQSDGSNHNGAGPQQHQQIEGPSQRL
ncbi:hypothetical protein LINPERPRIM_LOCUS28470 [Linum perenne]